MTPESEEKDGSIYFTSDKVGDFRFFVDRHQNEDKPLVDTWLVRPNEDDVEMFLILQNYKLLFTIHPDGTVSLSEQVSLYFMYEAAAFFSTSQRY